VPFTPAHDDLALKKSLWVYTKDGRRCLLLSFVPAKDNKHEKTLRSLGATAITQLQAVKIIDVEVIVSTSIDVEHLVIFYNSRHLSNYNFTHKTEKGGLEEEKGDYRLTRTKQTLDNFTFSHKKEFETSEKFMFYKHCAEATIYARNLANTRGNPATPQWMKD